LRLFHHRHRHGFVAFAWHDPMMQDETILIFQDAHIQAQFHRHAGFPFADPLGVFLEQGEDLLLMRNRLPLEHPSVDLIDLSMGMLDKAFHGGTLRLFQRDRDYRRLKASSHFHKFCL